MLIVPTLWIRLSSLFAVVKDGTWAMICSYSNRISRLAPERSSLPLILTEVNTEGALDGGCAESRRCLDFDCPLNRTFWQSYAVLLKLPPDVKKPRGFGRTMRWNRRPDGGLRNFKHLFPREKKNEPTLEPLNHETVAGSGRNLLSAGPAERWIR